MPDSAYQAETRGVVVKVTPAFAPDQSDEAQSRFVWSYTVEIENHGEAEVQLISRHWIITDARNRVEEVKGPGVIGEQPTLKPGEAFRYSSYCPLTTTSGTMRGSYRMVNADGAGFDAVVPEFSLDLPGANRRVN